MSCTISMEEIALISKKMPVSINSPLKHHKKKSKVIKLPRGGYIVSTKTGNIQFGLPPDTIKDCLTLGINIPKYFIIPSNRFNKIFGVNVAEFEFPAYFNFFINKQKINLICTKEAEISIRVIFQETLLGPKNLEV